VKVTRAQDELCWKADTRPLHQTIDSILARDPAAIAPSADGWFFCAMVERDPAAAERALVALGDNICWGESAINLSRKFGEGLLARVTKDEARARAAFGAARAEQQKIVEAQPDYGPAPAFLASSMPLWDAKRKPWKKDGARSHFFPWRRTPSMAAA
jgi:hypothetical protein